MPACLVQRGLPLLPQWQRLSLVQQQQPVLLHLLQLLLPLRQA